MILWLLGTKKCWTISTKSCFIFEVISYLPTNSDALIKAPDKKHIAVATLYCSLNGKSSITALSVSLVPIKAPNPKKVWYAMIDFFPEKRTKSQTEEYF